MYKLINLIIFISFDNLGKYVLCIELDIVFFFTKILGLEFCRIIFGLSNLSHIKRGFSNLIVNNWCN